jgi:molybdenum-dependent DNA-binding transcriptional regulator ModE
MEHIVQFAIGIDDETIKQKIEEKAEKEIIQNIEKSIRNNLFNTSYYGRGNETSLTAYSTRLIENFLEKHKEEILEKTAVYLAEKLVRTKAGKALLEQKGETNERR